MEQPLEEEVINIEDTENNTQSKTQTLTSSPLNKDDIETLFKSCELKLSDFNNHFSYLKKAVLKLVEQSENSQDKSENNFKNKNIDNLDFNFPSTKQNNNNKAIPEKILEDSLDELARLFETVDPKNIPLKTNVPVRFNEENEDVLNGKNDINNIYTNTKLLNDGHEKTYDELIKERFAKGKRRTHVTSPTQAVMLSKKKFREKLPGYKCSLCSEVRYIYIVIFIIVL